MNIQKKIAEELNIKEWQVEAVIKLIDEGNTIPFIARYRKEAHGSLDDEQLRNLSERLAYLRNLEEKKQQVLASIEEQGKLTEELKKQILEAQTQVVVDDLYRPYRPKRRTRATIAKEKGLDGLAQIILVQETTKSLEEEAQSYLSEEKGVETVKDAIDGARDIIAEQISDEADYRMYIRKLTMEEGVITSTAKDEKEQSVYEMYYEFQEQVNKIAGHRVLALNRGEKEKMLVIRLIAPEERILQYLRTKVITAENANTEPVLAEAVEDSYKRLIAPAIEREVRNELTEKAEDGAIRVFGKNLEQLLMAPPIAGKTVLGWDPAFRTGCKLAVVDPTGKVLDTTVIYPTAPQNKVDEAKRVVKKLIDQYDISLISVGNGTASRESEQVIEGTDLEDNKITSNKDVAAILRRAKMWSATDLSAALAGADPMKAIGTLVARFWERDMQKELIAILSGVFGTVPAGGSGTPPAETRLESNILDISGLSGTKANWSGAAFIDAEQKLGDAKAQLTGVCMHSATEAYLKKQNLIDTVQPSNDVAFGTYQGKRVIVDDGCPVSDGTYTTYLFGNGALALGNGHPVGFVPTETDRAKRKGSGVDYLINRKTMILHPRGIAWQNTEVAKTEGPSRTEVANPKNWKPVYEPKQIRIVAFKHKLG